MMGTASSLVLCGSSFEARCARTLRMTHRIIRFACQTAAGIATRLRDLAARCARGMVRVIALGCERARGTPGARCTHGPVCKCEKHTSVVTTVTPVSSGVPRAVRSDGLLRENPW